MTEDLDDSLLKAFTCLSTKDDTVVASDGKFTSTESSKYCLNNTGQGNIASKVNVFESLQIIVTILI